MRKTAGKIAMMAALAMLAAAVTSCVEMAVLLVQATVEIGRGVVAVGEAIGDEIENAQYAKAAETVILYDEIDTF